MVANNLIYTYDFSNNSWSKFMQLPMQQIHKYSCATRISKDGQIVVDIISTLWAKKVTGPHIWTQWTEPVDQITHWTIDVETRQFTKYVLDVLQFGNLVIDYQNYYSNFSFLYSRFCISSWRNLASFSSQKQGFYFWLLLRARKLGFNPFFKHASHNRRYIPKMYRNSL